MKTTAKTAAPRVDRVERLDYADRWLCDGFRSLQENPPGFMCSVDVEMTQAKRLVDALRGRGLHGSYAAVLVRAAGLALSRVPDMNQTIVGNRRLRPATVNVGLSVANEAAAAPVLRIDDVPGKPLSVVCEEIFTRAPEVRAEDSRTLSTLRRWGWLLPAGWMRRLLLRALLKTRRFREVFGSLQVTILPNAEVAVPLVVGATAALAMGRVMERVVARDGQPVVRLMATLVVVGDHKTWSGYQAGKIMVDTRKILESQELFAEIPRSLDDDASSQASAACSADEARDRKSA